MHMQRRMAWKQRRHLPMQLAGHACRCMLALHACDCMHTRGRRGAIGNRAGLQACAGVPGGGGPRPHRMRRAPRRPAAALDARPPAAAATSAAAPTRLPARRTSTEGGRRGTRQPVSRLCAPVSAGMWFRAAGRPPTSALGSCCPATPPIPTPPHPAPPPATRLQCSLAGNCHPTASTHGPCDVACIILLAHPHKAEFAVLVPRDSPLSCSGLMH